MDIFCIEIAGAVFEIHSRFGSTRVYFGAYLTGQPPQAVFEAAEEEILHEQLLLDEEADREGLRRRAFSEMFLERSVFQRKAAQFLLTRGIVLLHGSCVAVDSHAYLFTADTGVGKSTHTRLWMQCFADRAVMVNDDRVFLQRDGDRILACGSPWSGKHGLHSNLQIPLAGICLLERGQQNEIRQLSSQDAYPMVRKQVFVPDENAEAALNHLTQRLLATVPMWRMRCTKEPSAAETAYSVMQSGIYR